MFAFDTECVGYSDPDRAVFVPFKKVVMAWSTWVHSLALDTTATTWILPVLHIPCIRHLDTLSVCISVSCLFYYFILVMLNLFTLWIMYINPNVYCNVPFLNVPVTVLLFDDTWSTTCKIFFMYIILVFLNYFLFSCYYAMTHSLTQPRPKVYSLENIFCDMVLISMW